jgi:hypothetical protein
MNVAEDLDVQRDVTAGGVISNTDATESTSTTTGALLTAGGAGIAKSVNVGLGVTAGGVISNTVTTESTSTSTGAIITAGGAGIAKSANVGLGVTAGGVISNTDATESTSTSTGAIITAGGAGIAKSVNVGLGVTAGGVISNTVTTESTSITTGALITAGGAGIAKNLYVGGSIRGMPSESWSYGFTPSTLTGSVSATQTIIKIGPVVTFQNSVFYVSREATAGSSDRMVMNETLPSKYRPAIDVYATTIQVGGAVVVPVRITSGGEVSVFFNLAEDTIDLEDCDLTFQGFTATWLASDSTSFADDTSSSSILADIPKTAVTKPKKRQRLR